MHTPCGICFSSQGSDALHGAKAGRLPPHEKPRKAPTKVRTLGICQLKASGGKDERMEYVENEKHSTRGNLPGISPIKDQVKLTIY